MSKNIGRWAVVAVVVVGIVFSGYNNLALFLSILGTDLTGWIFSLAGLALFDAGAVGWALFFTGGATGSAQRSLALLASLACLLLTISGAALHLLLVQSLILVPDWAGQAAMFTIIAALAINLASGYAVHMADPETRRKMQAQEQADQILDEAYRQTQGKVKEIAGSVANVLSDEMREDAIRVALASTHGGDNRPQLPAPVRLEKPAPETVREVAAPRAPKAEASKNGSH